MTGVILILSIWLHIIINVILRKFRIGDYKVVRFALIALITAVIGIGAYNTITAPDTKKESQENLRKELEINSKKLEEQQKQTTTTTANTSVSEDNVNVNGNAYKSITAVGDSVMLGASP